MTRPKKSTSRARRELPPTPVIPPSPATVAATSPATLTAAATPTAATMLAEAALASLSRAQLQQLCKEHGLRANGKTVDLIAALCALEAAPTAVAAAAEPAAAVEPVVVVAPSKRPRCLVHGAEDPSPSAATAGVVPVYVALQLVAGRVLLAGQPFVLADRIAPQPGDADAYHDNLLCAACVDHNTQLATEAMRLVLTPSAAEPDSNKTPLVMAPAAAAAAAVAARKPLVKAHNPSRLSLLSNSAMRPTTAGVQSPRFACDSPVKRSLVTSTASPHERRQRGEKFLPGYLTVSPLLEKAKRRSSHGGGSFEQRKENVDLANKVAAILGVGDLKLQEQLAFSSPANLVLRSPVAAAHGTTPVSRAGPLHQQQPKPPSARVGL